MQKKVVYILHGWAISSENETKWEKVRALLDKSGVETIFLPLPGLSTPLKKAWTLDDYSAWLHTQLPKNKKVILLGHSFGGQLAVRFTATHPENVALLILIASAGIRDFSFPAVAKRSFFYGVAKLGGFAKKNQTLASLLYKLARESDYHTATPVMKKTMSAVIADEVRNDLAKIDCPTLVVWGKRDKVTPYKNTTLFLDIKNSSLVTVPEARHSPQFTHPEFVAKSIVRFLEDSTS